MKALVISHTPFNTYNNMGKTMLTLFSNFKKEELCQLYIYPTVPDIDKCESYFRITDKDILKSYCKFKVKGKCIQKNEIDTNKHCLFENKEDEILYRNVKNKRPLRILLRDTMWKFAPWFNRELKQWIVEQQPTCIFIAPGVAKFLYKMALKISKRFHLPIIAYICDDYYFLDKAPSLLGRIQQKRLRKEIKCLLLKSAHAITICDELKQEYQKEFKVETTTIMTGSNYTLVRGNLKENNNIRAITYMGGLARNRWQSLIEIGEALQKINEKHCTEFCIYVYTGETNKEILAKLSKVSTIRLCGFLTGEMFDKTFREADVLLHTEAFDKGNVDLVKYSMSTKIADSLSSGICLFAYGPINVASIKYLLDNHSAIVCIRKDQLVESLEKLFFDPDEREKVVQGAIKTALKNHDAEKVGVAVYNLFQKVTYEGFAG